MLCKQPVPFKAHKGKHQSTMSTHNDTVVAAIVTKATATCSSFTKFLYHSPESCITRKQLKQSAYKGRRDSKEKGDGETHLCGVAGFAGRNMSHHHVHQARCTAKDLRTSILQEGLHILTKDGRLQVHAELIQHLLHAAFMLPKNLPETSKLAHDSMHNCCMVA